MKLINKSEIVFNASKVQPHKVPDLTGRKWWARDVFVLGKERAVYTNGRSCYFHYEGMFWYVPNGGFISSTEVRLAPEGTKLPGNSYRTRQEAFVGYDASFREGLRDTNDCTVWSVKVLMGCSYKEAHQWCKDHGRKDGHGMYFQNILRAQNGEMFGKKLVEMELSSYKYKTVQQVVNEHWMGKYFVFVRGHVFAMVDGVIHDARYFNRSRVTSVVKVID